MFRLFRLFRLAEHVPRNTGGGWSRANLVKATNRNSVPSVPSVPPVPPTCVSRKLATRR